MEEEISLSDAIEQIYESGLKFLIPLTPQETYRVIAEETGRLFRAEYVTILLANRSKLQRVYTFGPKEYQLKFRRNGYTYTTFRTGKPHVIPIGKLRQAHPETPESNIKTVFTIPLIYQKKISGVINLQSTKELKDPKKYLKMISLFSSIATLAIRNTQQYAAAQEAIKARNIFISMAAHELRTPLTPINGYAQMIHQKLLKGQKPDPKWAAAIKSRAQKLSKTVQSLLQVDQIKKGEFHYKLTHSSIDNIISKALDEFKNNYPNYEIVVEKKLKNGKEKIIADQEKISYVITQILSNAAQFSNANEPIELIIEDKKSNILMSIKDRGIGIPQEDKPFIFGGFHKGSNTTKESIGLGLFICKSIIDHHKGTIKVYSKVKKGTLVEIKLPKLIYDN